MLERLKRCRAPIRTSQVREAVGGGVGVGKDLLTYNGSFGETK